MTSATAWVEVRDVPRLPPRSEDAHKGTFGKVLLVAGSTGMSGAAVLAGTAALRGGAGLVQLAVPSAVAAIVAAGQPCYMVRPVPADGDGRLSADAGPIVQELAASASAVAIGPGLGQSAAIRDLVKDLAGRLTQPLVLDADALNVLGANPAIPARPGPLLLTPHPGEFARLIGRSIAEVQAHRREMAFAFARQHSCVVLLKGAGTVVTDGERLYVNTTGNPGMATGGTGDVLTGLLAALLAGGMPAFDAAVLGAYVHGLAGDLGREEMGETALIAADLLTHLPRAFQLVARSGEPSREEEAS